MDLELEITRIIEGITQGFERTPREIIIGIAVILGFLLFLLITYLIQNRRIKKDIRRRAEDTYLKLIDQYSLSPEEENLVSMMSKYLKEPVKKYQILSNQSTFNACAERVLEGREVEPATLSRLRVKLGFTARSEERIPHSSADLTPETSVLLKPEQGDAVRGRVASPEPNTFTVRLEKKPDNLPEGAHVDVYYPHKNGIIHFKSRVQTYTQGILFLDHSEDLQRIQRRKYYRVEKQFPVYIRQAGSKVDPIQAEFVDIGGGGASVRLEGPTFGPGRTLELSFHPDSQESLSLLANVVRTSERGKRLHLRFQNMRESIRDKLYKIIFRRERSKQEPSV